MIIAFLWLIFCVSLCLQSTWKTASSNQESSVLQNWCECPGVSTELFIFLFICTLHTHTGVLSYPCSYQWLALSSGWSWGWSYAGNHMRTPKSMYLEDCCLEGVSLPNLTGATGLWESGGRQSIAVCTRLYSLYTSNQVIQLEFTCMNVQRA